MIDIAAVITTLHPVNQSFDLDEEQIRADERQRILDRIHEPGSFEGPAIIKDGHVFVPYYRVVELITGELYA